MASVCLGEAHRGHFCGTLPIENPNASLELFPEEAYSSGASSCRRRWPSGSDLGLGSDVVDDIDVDVEVVGVGVQLRGLQLVDLVEDEQESDPGG